MESDLYHLIYEGKLEQIHIKYILYQILKALHYLHSASIIHRDLKPSNILINNDCFVRVCDFGLVRLMGEDTTQDIMT
jgi:mitogen-activated protein kinase 15